MSEDESEYVTIPPYLTGTGKKENGPPQPGPEPVQTAQRVLQREKPADVVRDKVRSKPVTGKRKQRAGVKKPLFVCRPLDAELPSGASQFEIIDGPFKGKRQALSFINRQLPDGAYMLMHEGYTVTKVSETKARVICV